MAGDVSETRYNHQYTSAQEAQSGRSMNKRETIHSYQSRRYV